MPGNDTTETGEATSTGSVSVLERFRQLSREKEKQQTAGSSSSQGSVTAVYLNNGIEKTDEAQKCSWEQERTMHFDKERNDKRTYEDRQYFDSKKRKLMHQGLEEKDVGITEYVNKDIAGFHGIIKQRFTDFQVNEIDIDGNIVKLTSAELPPEPPEEELSEDHSGILTNEDWAKITQIFENKTKGEVFSLDVTDMEKTKRSSIHKDVKRRFGADMISNTVEKNGRKTIQIGYNPSKKEERRGWLLNKGSYLHFVVHKENADTTETIHMLSHKLRLKPNLFSYAGTKDKRGVTTQLMSLRKTLAERLVALKHLRGVKLGNFCYKNKSLRLGHLKGNHFKMGIRCVDVDDELIQKAVSSLKECGFINYFGLQRFGVSQKVPTHMVGKAVLKNDFKEAVELILKPKPGERTYYDVEKAKEVWWQTRDPRRAIRCLRRSERSIEGKILWCLAKIGPNAYINALEALPRNSLMLYLHSYQSRIWNIVVSRRIKKYGLKPVPGDLVFQNPDTDKIPLETDDLPVESDSESTEGEANEEDKGQADKLSESSVPDYKLVRKLSENEVDSITIEKVVYPLLGFDAQLPDNEIADWYIDLLKEDGLSMDMFKKSNKLFSISGSYRSMITKPWNLKWHTIRYSEQNADLIRTDADEMEGKPPIESIPDGQYKALILEFSLRPSVYATMALRELLKCETSTTHQALLTQQHLEQTENQQQTDSKKTDEPTSANNCKLNDDNGI